MANFLKQKTVLLMKQLSTSILIPLWYTQGRKNRPLQHLPSVMFSADKKADSPFSLSSLAFSADYCQGTGLDQPFAWPSINACTIIYYANINNSIKRLNFISRKRTENLMIIIHRMAREGRVDQYSQVNAKKIKLIVLYLSFSNNGTRSKIQNMHIPILLDFN